MTPIRTETVEVRLTPIRTEIIIRAACAGEVIGEKGRRNRELTVVVQKSIWRPRAAGRAQRGVLLGRVVL